MSAPLHLAEGAHALRCDGDSMRMDFWIGPNGAPRTAEYVMECGNPATGKAGTASARVDYEFSRFGEKITIKRPAKFRTS
jgi:hypothetical protein